MQNMKKIFIIFALLLTFCYVNVGAVSCPYNVTHDLNTEVSHIKIKYEVKEKTFDFGVSGCDGDPESCNVTYEYFDVSILNMSENFYVVVKNNYNNETKKLYFKDADKDGVVHFEHPYIMEKVTYTLTFYATDKTGCYGNKIKSYTKAFPRKNLYYFEELCDDIPNAEVCQKFVFYDEIEFKNFYNIATAEIEEKNGGKRGNVDDRNVLDKIIDFVVDNKWIFIGGAAGAVVVGFAISFNRKRKQDEKNI